MPKLPDRLTQGQGAFTGRYASPSTSLMAEVTFSYGGKSATARGYVDTGCSTATITQAVADALGLTSANKTAEGRFVGATGAPYTVPIWSVDVQLPGGIVVGSVAVHVTSSVLLGMGVLGLGDLSVGSGAGGTSVSFRYPGRGGEDYAADGGDRADAQASDPQAGAPVVVVQADPPRRAAFGRVLIRR